MPFGLGWSNLTFRNPFAYAIWQLVREATYYFMKKVGDLYNHKP